MSATDKIGLESDHHEPRINHVKNTLIGLAILAAVAGYLASGTLVWGLIAGWHMAPFGSFIAMFVAMVVFFAWALGDDIRS